MVNMDKVIERVLRGVYTSGGVLVADNIEDFIADQTGLGQEAVSGIGFGIGAASSIFVDDLTDMVGMNRRGFVNDAVEFAGYGVQGASLNNLVESVTGGSAYTPRHNVRVNANAGRTATVQTGTTQTVDNTSDDQILLESP